MLRHQDEKEIVNDGYMHPMVCDGCLKIWVDNEPPQKEADFVNEKTMSFLGHDIPIRKCTRCTYEERLR